MPKNKGYILSQHAEYDIDKIFKKSKRDYGIKHAVDYVNHLKKLILHLATHPDMGKDRPDIREGLQVMPYKSHIILYRILDDKIRVVRVVGGEMDLPNLLFLQ